jgi:hypothetical protein
MPKEKEVKTTTEDQPVPPPTIKPDVASGGQ